MQRAPSHFPVIAFPCRLSSLPLVASHRDFSMQMVCSAKASFSFQPSACMKSQCELSKVVFEC